MTEVEIVELAAEGVDGWVEDLASLLAACVRGGGAVGFVLPFEPADGRRFWREEVLPAVRGGRRALFAARAADRLVGTVQLVTALPANQPHRCEIAKMMVHPDARRQGVAYRLLEVAEERARRLGKALVTLDTRTGDAAERLYARIGYRTAGVIPGYALDPDGRATHATTYMYKRL